MQKIFIHVGYPKSASTMLQSNFFLNLKNVNFINDKSFYEALLLREFPGGEGSRKKKIEYFDNKISPKKINILSSEHFCMPSSWLNSDKRKFYSRNNISLSIKKKFPGAKIILIIRKQKDWIESWYQERVKRNELRKINSLLVSDFFINDIKPYLDYNLVYSHYKKHFGSKNVKMIPMEIIKKNPQFFSNQLTNFLGLKKVKIHKFPIYRSSQSSTLTETKRLINIFLINFKFKKNSLMSNLILKIYKKVSFHLFFLSKFVMPIKIKDNQKNLMLEFKNKNKILDEKLKLNLKKYDYY